MLFSFFSSPFVNDIWQSRVSYNDLMETLTGDFQSYILEKDLKEDDISSIIEWNKNNRYVYIRIFNDENRLFYSSFNTNELDIKFHPENNNFYNNTIYFKNQPFRLEMVAYFEAKHRYVLSFFCKAVSTLLSVSLFYLLIRKKIKYIEQIENGINIIKTGGLEYEIPIKGKDELAYLAININQMSKLLKEKFEIDERDSQKKREIVTGLSHDLRTPLTSVICYLDLIADDKYTNEEKLKTYVNIARAKTYQIKSLIDNLFECSIESSKSKEYIFEAVDGVEVLEQILFEVTYTLRDLGFNISYETEFETRFYLNINIFEFKRIFDNLSSNIMKYADKNSKILFLAKVDDGKVILESKNFVSKDINEVESHGIGLKTIESIISMHSGTVSYEANETEFSMKIALPIQTDNL